MKPIRKSNKLDRVCYDIRGPVLEQARKMEEEGHHIIKLNIGNLAAFGFDSPEEIQLDMIRNLPSAAGYSDAKGIFSARKAVMHYTQQKHIQGVTLDDIYIGNGVSELIVMAMNALLNAGDEVLVPTPDYPLWTAAVSLSSGTPRHYLCDEGNDWLPDLKDLRAKITPRTRALVVINPNNPTGALYPENVLLELVDIARQHNLIIYADEVYDKVLYDGATHTAIASLSTDVLTVTFNGLSKNYRSCGYRAGWMVVSGDLRDARDYIEGLDMLASMRLCSNVPGQHAIQTALGGYQSIDDLVAPGGRMCRQRDLAYELITAIPGVTCVKPKAALYMFPRLDPKVYPIRDDQKFIAEMLQKERVLLVQGSGFNWPHADHFRLVFLPHEDDLRDAIARIARFLEGYRQRAATPA
ncbi:MAG: Glutamate-pyruvate aminotransferase AlaA [Candidatus Accumulibacter regalis]|mgnify:FL=1|uniref:Glutamate-pyruvate aminotransferase AlaA n=1 Tax=Accumulibacter regalis TaxID=522306 RepID=A0A011RD56_ACCRE|nr:pyridoxal phosphate-dependent aminotransferase [Accumulibacter sp.]EXI89174.1 MAG: Glutamate-pyruvate aminotransferase AlaA [Candidatus Accumulibacter regalis]HRE71494.1 pyridoxal phosphate-dependent aminotransferase [Accumulibacter sp.]HRE85375.1 pyridoxal phosphate-dependent aminotransferase [Accumulibacter sp.]HRF06823.1 pyridoxal phosphate-dependent aminotransferase [Accumulibacter sp.]